MTPHEPAHVDVEMVGVAGVVIGAQDHVEQQAGARPQIAQERRRWTSRVPVPLQAHQAAVCQFESGNIEGVGGGMFAHPAAAAHGTAGVASKMRDAADL